MEPFTPLAASAFLAGTLMFFAPCTLPLLPAYLAFISGVSEAEGVRTHQARFKILTNAAAFVVGFSLVFILFGVLAGLLGAQLVAFQSVLTQIGGVFIILCGLWLLQWLPLPRFLREERTLTTVSIRPGRPLNAFLIGSFFAAGWTPCVGPILASVLLLAGTSATMVTGAWLLTLFSLGLAIPFLLVALFYAQASRTLPQVQGVSRFISWIGGLFLIFIGILLVTNQFGLTVEYGYRLFDFFGFSALFNYL